MTALGILGGALGFAGRGALGATKLGGRTMISHGIIGSMARWTVASMVLESIPNPGARKQAIDKALYEANKEAERHYSSIKEDLKRSSMLRKRQREFDFMQRVAISVSAMIYRSS